MIISASRRTDIPNYYMEWFVNRLSDGYAYVRNPYNPRRIRRIALSTETVDCIVFWTKNPIPAMKHIIKLKNYKYCFQFTVTGYGSEIEPGIPELHQIIRSFQELSVLLGPELVIWRYDPIVINKKYNLNYHIEMFGFIAASLKGYTNKAVISFVDDYRKNTARLTALDIEKTDSKNLAKFACELASIAKSNGMSIETCAEKIDLSDCGIIHGSCISRELVESTAGYKIKTKIDKNQRPECGCIESIDIGAYDTCRNSCLYCYAVKTTAAAAKNHLLYDPSSPLLCGRINEDDIIYDPPASSVASLRKDRQIEMF